MLNYAQAYLVEAYHGVRATQEPTKCIHKFFSHFLAHSVRARDPNLKKGPEAAMGGGIGPLNVALESVTTAQGGVVSQTPTDRSQFLNF